MAKSQRVSDDFIDHLSTLDNKYNLPSGTLKKIAFIETELGENRNTSSAGAQGLFQFMPGTAKRFNVNVKDDYSSAEGAAKYMSHLLNMFDGNVDKAVSAYNWGEGNVQKKGLARAPFETRNYLSIFRDGIDLNKNLKANRQKSIDRNLSDVFSSPSTITAGGKNATGTFTPITQEQAAQDPDYAAYQQYLAQQNQAQQPSAAQQSADTSNNGQDIINDIASNPPADISGMIANPINQTNNAINNSPVPIQPTTIGNPNSLTNTITQEQAAQDPDYAAYKQYLAQQNQAQQPSAMPMDMNTGQPSTINSTEPVIPDLNAPVQTTPEQQDMNKYLDTSVKSNFKDYVAQPKIQQIMTKWNSIPENRKEQVFSSLSPMEQNFVKMYYTLQGQEPSDKNFALRLAEGAADVGNRGANFVAEGVAKLRGDDKTLGNLQRQARNERFNSDLKDLSENQGGARTLGRVVGEVAPALTGTGLASSVAGKVAERAALGGLGSAIANPSESTPDQFVSDTAKNAAIGAVVSPLAGAVGDKIGARLANRVYGRDKLNEADTAFINEARDIGVNPTAADLPNSTREGITKVQNMTSDNKRVSGQVSNNLKALTKETERLRDSFDAYNPETYVGAGTKIDTASQKNTVLGNEAKAFKESVANMDLNSANDRVKVALGSQLLTKKAQANELYEAAKEGLNEKSPMMMPNVQMQLVSMLDSSKQTSASDIKVFRNLVNDFTEIDGRKVNDFDRFTLDRYEPLRQNINRKIQSALISEDPAIKATVEPLTKLKNSLDEDIFDNLISRANGDQSKIDAAQTARDFYRRNIVPLENDIDVSKYFDYTRVDSPSNDILKIVKSPQLTKKLIKYGDEQSNNSLRLGVMNDILNRATRNGTTDDISPKALNNAIKQYVVTTGGDSGLDILFKGNAADKLKTLANVSKNMRAFDSYANLNPKTGEKIYRAISENAGKILLTGGTVTSIGTGGILPLVSAAGLAGVSKLYERHIAKALTDPKKYAKLVELSQADPRKLSFSKKVGDVFSMLSAMEAANSAN